jgi:hypothetical protein
MECCVLIINYDVSVWGPTEVETYVIVTNQNPHKYHFIDCLLQYFTQYCLLEVVDGFIRPL